MTSILTRMSQGNPGDITRPSQSTVEAQVGGATAFAAYGIPVKMVSGKILPLANADTAAVIYGFLVRPFPIQGTAASDPLGTATPQGPGRPQDVLKRGYMSVVNKTGTPAAGGAVYIHNVTGDAGLNPGDIEATSTASHNVVLSNAFFTGSQDSNGNVEIAFNI